MFEKAKAGTTRKRGGHSLREERDLRGKTENGTKGESGQSTDIEKVLQETGIFRTQGGKASRQELPRTGVGAGLSFSKKNLLGKEKKGKQTWSNGPSNEGKGNCLEGTGEDGG